MLGAGRDLCGSSSPTPLLKEGHLQQAAQDLVQAGPEYLQRRRLHNLPGQPVPVLRHPQREEVLPHVQMELPVLQFVSNAAVTLGTLLPFPGSLGVFFTCGSGLKTEKTFLRRNLLVLSRRTFQSLS